MKIETKLPLGDVDMGVAHDLTEVPGAARQAEELGFDGLVAAEVKSDPFLVLAAAATSTTKMDLTTSVAIAFPRSPAIVALQSWDLQRSSKGRFILGLGTQVKGHIERRYGMEWKPAGPWLRDYINAVRAVWDSWQSVRPLKYEGEYYRLSLMPPAFNPGPIDHPRIPIHIAAVNQYNCRLAGEICDGIRVHGLHSRKYLEEFILPNVEDGARRAGRSLDDVEVCVGTLSVIAPDDDALAQGIEDMRRRISFYGSTRTYKPVFEIHGWGNVVDELHQMSLQGRWEEMPRLITDEMVEAFAFTATFDNIVERARQRFGGLADRVQLSVPGVDVLEAGRIKEILSAIKSEG